MIDLSMTLADLPKKAGARKLKSRQPEEYITVHYSGVVYGDNTERDELARIGMETRYQLNKNWGTDKEPIYGDGLMYDYVVLKTGAIVRTRNRRLELWHCGNTIGNALSWSIHVMLGRGERLTPSQKVGLYTLIDRLRYECNIPRQNVVGHCEWPRGTGKPVRGDVYKIQPKQSECPGPLIMRDVYEYRAMTDVLHQPYVDTLEVIGNIPFTYVRTARSFDSAVATINGTPAMLAPGSVIEYDDLTDGWVHLVGGLGFVTMSDLKVPGTPDPEFAIQTSAREYSQFTWLVTDTQATINPDSVVAYIANLPGNKYTYEQLQHIVYTYKAVGEEVSVDWVFALAQNFHETDKLRSWWAQPPRHNPAGLWASGATAGTPTDQYWAFDESIQLWRRGMTFPDWDHAIRTHYAYLVLYATTEGTMTPAQRAIVEYAPNRASFKHRGVAQQARGLSGRWAPSAEYASKIAVMANALMRRAQ